MYPYIGPRDIRLRAASGPVGSPIHSKADHSEWVGQYSRGQGEVSATFVIDLDGVLLLAERHSEHVVCAGGAPVLAAGELILEGARGAIVAGITNQSTGYCPEAFSWSAVQAALSRLKLTFPDGFTHVFTFRRCEACGQINVVKDGDYTCAVCLHALAVQRNL
ncbi:hypothetical protein [Deinococcus planocerae]|uniref:hypothetical protein n=1 Tax=Deinococcus planocerae TaxID=1737569 RepID=UPI001CA4AA67|nr:hypothetical protein [Deinococcus planocerae]